jgi:DNA-binding transcriptional LysR family regulator
MDKFSEMQMFVSVVDASSVTVAARRLGTTKSSVSERLTQLERRLGTILAERGRPVRPTLAGSIFYEHSVQILAEVNAAENAVAAARSSLSGSLRVAVPMAFGIRYLPPMLAQFAMRYPDLCLDTESDDRYVNMHDENFDMAIRLGNLRDSTLVAQPIARNRHLICASPAYLSTRGVPQSCDDLQEHEGLLYSNREPQGTWQLPVDGTIQSFRIRARLRTDSGHLLLAAARAGLGLAILPTFLAAEAIAANELQIVLPQHSPSGGSISAVYRKTHRSSPKIRALLAFLTEQIGAPPVWDRSIGTQLAALADVLPDDA